MAADRKEYQLVLVALAAHGTLGNRINKLRKVWSITEDETLKELLSLRLKELKTAWEQLEKQSATFVGNLGYSCNKPLVDYCQSCLSSGKPQWQIIAERAGWTPPR